MPQVVILGSGMAGFGAAHRLFDSGMDSVMYDKRAYHGGHTASHSFEEGFTIDEGPHISFTSNKLVQSLLAENVEHEYETHTAYVNNYWRGHWIPHPAQCNLHGLPADLVSKIIADYPATQQVAHGPIRNYAQWLKVNYGETFAKTFPMVYGKKYHTTTADNMSTDWIGPRMYQATLDEVVRGASTPDVPNVHYVTEFRYPKQGGFVSFLKGFLRQTDLRLNHELVGLDPKAKTVRFRNGVVDSYDHVISSVPLPELIPLIAGVPPDVLAASRRLACSEVVIVSIGLSRPDPLKAHWTYFYDEDVFFTRLSTPHMQSRENVPPGCSCVMAECYYSSKYRPLDRRPEECIQPVLEDLRRCGVVQENDEIVFTNAMRLKYANVIFDLERAEALRTVHAYLDEVGVSYCGRYGLWAYIWTDQAFLSGAKAAENILGRREKVA